MKKHVCTVLVLATMLLTSIVHAEESEVKKLAAKYGCLTCHDLQPKKSTSLPIAPSFAEIAKRFHADTHLTYADMARIIKYGSSPYRSLWQGKIRGLAMPPNDDTISDLEINRLLVWILTEH